MKKMFRVKKIMLIAGLMLTGLVCVASAGKAPGKGIVLNAEDDRKYPGYPKRNQPGLYQIM